MGCSRSGWSRAVAATLLGLGGAPVVSAQTTDLPAFINGVVVDGVTADEMPGAWVELRDFRTVLTDDDGVFQLTEIPPGPYVLTISQFGYETQVMDLDLPLEANAFLQIELEPKPYMIEGVGVVADRLASVEQALAGRRSEIAVSVGLFKQDRILETSETDARKFLLNETGLTPMTCPVLGPDSRLAQMNAGTCFMRRGKPIAPVICVDEIPASLDELASYRPMDLYLIEVYSAGELVRVYTRWFIEGMLERPRTLGRAERRRC